MGKDELGDNPQSPSDVDKDNYIKSVKEKMQLEQRLMDIEYELYSLSQSERKKKQGV